MKLSSVEFNKFRTLIFDEIGIYLDDTKVSLMQNRLFPRLIYHKLLSFRDYFQIVKKNDNEKTQMFNLMTTNETYFFREHQHFDFLKSVIKELTIKQNLHVWSAASSVGSEAYSIAMLLDATLHKNQWSVLGSDINTEVIEMAKEGLYKESWIDKIPLEFRIKYCLKGKRKFDGMFIIDRQLQKNVSFDIHNLLIEDHSLGLFDVIFLRNVLIYFDSHTQLKVINNVLSNLKVGGYLVIGLTESLDNMNTKYLKKHQSSIYIKMG